MIFRIRDEIFAKVPEFVVGVIVARGIDNTKSPEESGIASLLAEGIGAALPLLSGKVKEHAKVLPYREAFTKFGINPNKYMCSIEALLSRIQKTGALPSINSVVDAGNAVSVRHFLPIGAHDIGAYGAGEAGAGGFSDAAPLVEIRCSAEGDRFRPFGAPEAEVAASGTAFEPGEVVYASGPLVRTRRWMWRQSELGKITESTQDVFVPIDGFAGFNSDEVLAARDELAAILRDRLGAAVSLGFVDREHPEFSVGL